MERRMAQAGVLEIRATRNREVFPNAPVIWNPRPPPTRAWPESPHIHQLIVFPWGLDEHSLSLLRSLIFRRLEVVRGREWADNFEPPKNQANFFTDERFVSGRIFVPPVN